MNKKQILLIVVVLLLGTGIFILINKKSKNNPGFDDKTKWTDHSQKLKNLEKKMQDLSSEIKNEMGKGLCKYDDDCYVVGLGVETCDGYNNFLVYSTRDTNEPELLHLVNQFNKTNQEFNETSLTVLRCGEKAKSPRCVDNRCTVSQR